MLNENDNEEIKETKQAINKAQEKLEEISQDEHERYLAELREKYIRDQVAVQEYGYIKGKEEGRKEGEINSKRDIAKKLLNEGMTTEMVAKITELTVDEVEMISLG